MGKGEQGEDCFECDGQTEGGKEELDVDQAYRQTSGGRSNTGHSTENQ